MIVMMMWLIYKEGGRGYLNTNVHDLSRFLIIITSVFFCKQMTRRSMDGDGWMIGLAACMVDCNMNNSMAHA